MLRKEEILERTSNGLNVFKHYITCQWRVGRNFFNPLYEDRKASCNIYFDRKGGIYKLKDFGNDEFSGDCFFFVGKLKGLDCGNGTDFVEILKIINRDMCLGLGDSESPYIPQRTIPQSNQPIPEPSENKPYNILQQQFTQIELDFWMQSGITPEILKLYKTASLKEFRSENKERKPFSYISPAGNGQAKKSKPVKQAWDFFIGGLASLNPFGVGLQPF
jgi:hypothetical protein